MVDLESNKEDHRRKCSCSRNFLDGIITETDAPAEETAAVEEQAPIEDFIYNGNQIYEY